MQSNNIIPYCCFRLLQIRLMVLLFEVCFYSQGTHKSYSSGMYKCSVLEWCMHTPPTTTPDGTNITMAHPLTDKAMDTEDGCIIQMALT